MPLEVFRTPASARRSVFVCALDERAVMTVQNGQRKRSGVSSRSIYGGAAVRSDAARIYVRFWRPDGPEFGGAWMPSFKFTVL